MREVLTCPICKSTKFEEEITCKDYTVSHENFQIKKCSACDFLVTTPTPQIEELPAYYQSDEYISHTSKANSLLDRVYLLVRSYTLNWKERLIKKSTQTTTKTILDYGCGTGEFLQKCKSSGWTIQGVEPSSVARTKAEIKCEQNIASTIQEIQQSDFQAITLWHVLEHIPNLNSTLEELYKKLHRNGRIIIAVPNPSSWDSTHYKKYWAAYDVPRHLWHFNQQNLDSLLRRHGFILEQRVPMKFDAYYVCLLSEKYQNNGKTTFLGVIRAFINGTRSNLHAKTDSQYSSIIYIAKK